MSIEIGSLLLLALGLGMLHALDADHIMAVTSLSCQKPDKKQSLMFCGRWALGHGAAILLVGVAVLFVGMAIPQQLSHYAESLVGVVLIALGVYVLWDIWRQRLHLHVHQHEGMVKHAHWHRHADAANSDGVAVHRHNHAPVLVGVLHGTAGSAPLLALLPLSQMSSPWIGLAYLLLFGVGVFFAMLLFGGALGQLFGLAHKWGQKFINGLRILVSLVSIGFGASLLLALN